MKKATLITHQGWADHFSSNGLVNYYSSLYDELVLFASTMQIAEMLKAIYSESKSVKVVVPRYVSNDAVNNRGVTCVKCHTEGSQQSCPRGSGSCEYIDYADYSDFENIKIGAFKGYPQWERYLRESKKSFAHCFYSYESLHPDLRIRNFRVSNVAQLDPPPNSYAVVHDDPTRGISIRESIKENHIQLNQLSKIMIDTITILENSKEIRLIDSSYSVFVYLLSFHNKKIASIPKHLHASVRSSRDVSIYSEPTPEMWSVL